MDPGWLDAGCRPSSSQQALILKRVIECGPGGGRQWQQVDIDLKEFVGQTVTLRLYQRVLLSNKTAGNAYGKAITVN